MISSSCCQTCHSVLYFIIVIFHESNVTSFTILGIYGIQTCMTTCQILQRPLQSCCVQTLTHYTRRNSTPQINSSVYWNPSAVSLVIKRKMSVAASSLPNTWIFIFNTYLCPPPLLPWSLRSSTSFSVLLQFHPSFNPTDASKERGKNSEQQRDLSGTSKSPDDSEIRGGAIITHLAGGSQAHESGDTASPSTFI